MTQTHFTDFAIAYYSTVRNGGNACTLLSKMKDEGKEVRKAKLSLRLHIHHVMNSLGMRTHSSMHT